MKKVTVISKSCRGCGCCVRACPKGVISFGRKAEIGEGCMGCGECVRACPFDAIVFKTSVSEE